MSGLDLLSTDENSAYFQPGYAPTDTVDIIGSSFTNIRENFNSDSSTRLVGDLLYQRNSLFKERFGKDIFQATGTDKKYPAPSAEGYLQQIEETYPLLDQMIEVGRKENPTAYDGIKTTAEIRAEGAAVAQQATKDYENVSMRNPSGMSRFIGSAIGGIGGAFTDPLNIATLPLGAGPVKVAGSGAFATAKAITLTAAKEGAIQAAIQAASIPEVAEWQNTIGNKYGVSEAATDIAMGFAGGAVIRGAGSAIEPAAKGIKMASSVALNKIADAAALPQTVKDSLRYMARVAYVDDAAPIKIETISDMRYHRDALDKVASDIESYGRPATDLPASIKERIASDVAAPFVERRVRPEIRQLERNQQDVLSSLYSKAETVKGSFDSTAKSIADDIGADVKFSDVKGAARATEKIIGDYLGDASKIKDLVRGTIVVDRLDQIETAVAAINQRFNVLKSGQRNLLDVKAKTRDGYRDAKFNVDVDGVTAEIQVNIPEMVQAKKDLHDVYKTRENLERTMRKNGQTPEGVAEVNRLDAKMKERYDRAWEDFLKRSKTARDTSAPLRLAEAGSKSRGSDLSQAVQYGKPGTEVGSVTGMPSTSQKAVVGENLGSDISPPTANVTRTQPESNKVFDLNAYKPREYREPPVIPPAEIKPSDRFQAAQANFDDLVKTNPDMMIDLDDGSIVKLSDYAARLQDDKNILEAITNCRLA